MEGFVRAKRFRVAWRHDITKILFRFPEVGTCRRGATELTPGVEATEMKRWQLFAVILTLYPTLCLSCGESRR